MSLRQKAVKGVVWTAIDFWGGQFISFGIFFLLARLLGPEAFGLVALASVFLAFMQVFLDQGFGQAIVQRENLEPEHLDTAFWSNFGFGVLLAGSCCIAADFVAAMFKQPALVPIIRWMSLNFIFSGLNGVQGAILDRNLSFKSLTLRSLASTVAGGVVGVTMALQGFGVWSLVGQSVANGLAGVLTLWSVAGWRPRFRFSKRHFKELFSYGINVVGISILNFVNRRSDDFLIGYFLGPVALGYYTIAYRILMITTQLMIQTIQRISMPVFSRMQQEPERLRQAFYRAVQITCLFAFPAFLCVSLLAPELVVIAFGDKWKPVIPVMQILGLSGFVQAGIFYVGPMLMAIGKPSWNLSLNCFQATCNVVGFLIAVHWGIVAVAIAYTIRCYATAPVYAWILNKALSIKPGEYVRKQVAPIIATSVMAVTLFGAKAFLSELMNVYVLLALYLAIGVTVYLGTILLIAPALFQEALNLARLMLPSKIKKNA